jgi:ribosomal protein S18 acetylase RimI-like enzyme
MDESDSVTEVDVREHESAVRDLLAEYVTWLEGVVRDAVGTGYETDFDALVERNLARLADPDEPTVAFLARADGRAVGFVYLRGVSATTAVVKRLWVCPEYRRRGIGRALATALVETAADRGYATLRLTTSPGMAAAQALYADLGFEAVEPFETEVPEEFHGVCRFMQLSLDDH